MQVVGFNKVFREFNRSTARYRIAKGSAGSGKSVNIAQDYILKLSDPKYQGANLLVVRGTEASHKDSTYAELCKAIKHAQEEIADVEIMLMQLKLMHGEKEIDKIVLRKIERQKERMEHEQLCADR